jgi:OOP family OmpA-OmpF porin
VRDYLVSKGIGKGRVSAQGFGETQPLASNDTSDGRARNRRVELAPTE